MVAGKKRSGQELRWSVQRKTDAVMRLLKGENLDTVARGLRGHRGTVAAPARPRRSTWTRDTLYFESGWVACGQFLVNDEPYRSIPCGTIHS